MWTVNRASVTVRSGPGLRTAPHSVLESPTRGIQSPPCLHAASALALTSRMSKPSTTKNVLPIPI